MSSVWLPKDKYTVTKEVIMDLNSTEIFFIAIGIFIVALYFVKRKKNPTSGNSGGGHSGGGHPVEK